MHQGGEMNRRVKIYRLVYLNKVWPNFIIREHWTIYWYYQQEPTVTMTITWHYFTFYSVLVRISQSPTPGTTVQKRCGQSEEGPKQGCKGGHRLENKTHKESLKELHICSVEKRMLRGELIIGFQYLKSIYREDRDFFTRNHVDKTSSSGYRLYWESWLFFFFHWEHSLVGTTTPGMW